MLVYDIRIQNDDNTVASSYDYSERCCHSPIERNILITLFQEQCIPATIAVTRYQIQFYATQI